MGNAICRDGLDVRIAFKACSKQTAEPVAEISGLASDVNADTGVPEANQAKLKSGLKAIARRVARYGYRLLRPFVRPLAFRMRRYLIDGLRQEFQHEIRQELQRVSTNTIEKMSGLRQETQWEIQRASTATTREIRDLRQHLQHEISAALTPVFTNLQLRDEHMTPRLDRIEHYAAATARRIAINCSAGEVLVRTQVGFVLCADSDHALLACLVDSGELELGTRLFIQKYLKANDVYVDVGANVGMHTLAAAHAMQGQGKIIAFEPFGPTKRMLEKSVWMNGFSDITEIHQAAVSSSVGRKMLFLGAASGHHSLFELNASPNDGQEPVEVPLVTLDDAIPSGQRIDLMKIDVEGAELDVIAGGTSLINNNPDIGLIVEFGPSHLRRSGESPTLWFAAFKQMGFDHRVINQMSGALEDWPFEKLEQADSANIFFARPNSAAWGRLE